MLDISKVTVTSTRKVLKYAEGVDPAVGEPFDTVVHQDVLTGQDAINYLNAQGPDGVAMVNNILNGGE